MLEIKGSVAVITGGGSGIGRALAEYWLRAGGKVVIADVVEEALSKTASELKAMGGEVSSIVCNVTHEQDCNA